MAISAPCLSIPLFVQVMKGVNSHYSDKQYPSNRSVHLTVSTCKSKPKFPFETFIIVSLSIGFNLVTVHAGKVKFFDVMDYPCSIVL